MTDAKREEFLRIGDLSEVERSELRALLECDQIRDDAFDDARLSASQTSISGSRDNTREMAKVSPGTILGDYHIEAEVGRGGMAVVYRARQLSLDRTVALKVLHLHLLTPTVRQRFQREAAAGARLHHENIVAVHQFGQQDGLLFFAMELIEGPTLAEWIAQQRLQDTKQSHGASDSHAQVCRWIVDVAEGLAHAHSHGVIHRDIKPSNLILTSGGRVKILDFGVAKLRLEAGLTTTSTLVGTPRYMSPEQLSPDGLETDHRADIYSLGATFYELLTLQPPYPGDDFGQVINAICNSDPCLPRQVEPSIPADLEAICLCAMAKDPRDRYQSGDEFARDLKSWLAGDPIRAVRRGQLSRIARAALLPRNRTAVVLTALLLICAAVITWFGLQASRGQSGPKQITFIGQEQFTYMEKDDYALDSTLSGDGRWLAYASDQSSNAGDMNIWLQRLSEPSQSGGSIDPLGDPIQITSDPANETEPAISPDGRLLAFGVTGMEGGIYLFHLDEDGTPGERIQLSDAGRGPKFSPDGKLISWWVGPMSRQLGILGDSIWIASSNGRDPRPFCPEFVMASYPVWSPDSKHLLFKGVLPPDIATTRNDTSEPDWWIAPVDGGWPAKPLVVMPLIERAGIAWSNLCAPSWWTPRSESILFSGFSHSGLKLWVLPFSPEELAVTGPPRLLTAGGLHEFFPATDSGLGEWERCCYTSGDFDYGIWSLPIDADRAVVTGEITCVAPNLSMDMTPSVSSDGRRIVFESLRGGPFDIWLQEGDEDARRLTSGPMEKGFSVISHDGSRIVYWESSLRTTFDATAIPRSMLSVIDLDRKDYPARTVLEDTGSPHDWFPSSPPRFVLTQRGGELSLVDAALDSEAKRADAATIVRRDGWWIDGGRFSPDGQWIAFSASSFGHTRQGQVFVAPFTLGEVVSNEDWIPIFDESDDSSDGHLPDWSPSGEVLYFLSDRDGCRCLWYQRLDPNTKRPLGAPLELYHFGEYRLSPQFQHWDLLRFSVARNRVVISLANCTGNVFVGRLEER